MARARFSYASVGAGIVSLLLLVGGCAHRGGAVLTPAGRAMPDMKGDAPATQHNLRADAGASFHLLQVASRQQPQRISAHEVVLFVVRGKLRLHLDAKDFVINVGDVVEIPAGTVHWAENLSSQPSVAYLVMTPPFVERAREIVTTPPTQVSPWHWTVWGH